jgi:hypothetical protein
VEYSDGRVRYRHLDQQSWFWFADERGPGGFQGLPPGCYRVKANSTEALYYYDPLVTPATIIGVIELRTDLNPASDYAFFDAVGAPKSPHFVLQFLNPLATWTYI